MHIFSYIHDGVLIYIMVRGKNHACTVLFGSPSCKESHLPFPLERMTSLLTTDVLANFTSNQPLKLLLVTKQTPSFTFLDRDPSNMLLQALVLSFTAMESHEVTCNNPEVSAKI